MAFNNDPDTTQIVIPSSAKPGDPGTVVIGGELPPELKAIGYTSGIVWYPPISDPTYKYRYLATAQFAPGGNTDIGVVTNAGEVLPNTQNTGGRLTNNLSTDIRYRANLFALDTGLRAVWTNDGTKTWLTDTTSGAGAIDVWIPFTFTGLLLGTTGVLVGEYRTTYDRIVDLRINITWSVATTATGTLVANGVLPAAIRAASTPTYNQPYAYGSYSTNLATGVSRVTTNTGQFVAFQLPAVGVNALTSTITYTMDK